jgi:hypothetical protein
MNYDDLKLQILLKQQQKNMNNNSVNIDNKSGRLEQSAVTNNPKKSASSNLSDVEVFDEKGNFIPPLQPLIINAVGKCATGKTYFIRSLIYYYIKQKYFKFGLVFTRTKFNGDFDFMPEEHIKEEYDEQFLKQYLSKLRRYKETKGFVPPNFLILDDMLGQCSVYSNFWTSLISTHRHYNLTLIISSQSITSKLTSTLLRECVNISVMFRSVFKNTIVALYECYGQQFEDYNEFLNVYLQVTGKKYHCLMFLNDKESKEKAYYSYIAPPNVPEFKIKF